MEAVTSRLQCSSVSSPSERSQSEHHVIYKLLKGIHRLTSQLGSQELKQISTVTTVETWDRGQIIFGHNGFCLILKGSVKPFRHETIKEDRVASMIAVGGSFGSCEPVNYIDGDANIQCVLTLKTCEILKISRSGYKKVKKDFLAQDHHVKMYLIQGCQLYLHWPKLSINHLVDSIQLKTFPANQVLVKEGKICPFVAFIGREECNIHQDVGSLRKTVDKKGCRIRFVLVGKLGPKQSFGEVSILLNQPSPCTVITATEVHGGIIQPECLKGLDSVTTTSLILQTAQPMCGKLSEEEVMKEFLTQERMKKWEHEKGVLFMENAQRETPDSAVSVFMCRFAKRERPTRSDISQHGLVLSGAVAGVSRALVPVDALGCGISPHSPIVGAHLKPEAPRIIITFRPATALVTKTSVACRTSIMLPPPSLQIPRIQIEQRHGESISPSSPDH
ncbi:unnamed protein product [Leuciscus chuanchicus]